MGLVKIDVVILCNFQLPDNNIELSAPYTVSSGSSGFTSVTTIHPHPRKAQSGMISPHCVE